MSECSCVYVGGVSSAGFCDTINPVAKKVHTCGECGRNILVGEEYENTRVLIEDYWERWC